MIFKLQDTFGIYTLAWSGGALVVYIFLLSFYRLYLHPLRKIPGPRLAAIAWWYEIYYDVILPGQYNFHLQKLHKRYGPILRVNPEEVHIADKNFLPELYDSRKRNRLYEASLDTADSVAGTTEYELHKKRRQAMTGFFSPKAVRQLEPMLVAKRDKVIEAIDKHMSSTEGPLNLSDLWFAYTWDLVHEYAFAMKTNVLSDLDEAHKLRENSTNLLLQVNFTRHFGWVNALAGLLPAWVGERMTPPGVRDLKEVAVRVRQNVDDVLRDEKGAGEDLDSSHQHRSIFYSLKDDPSLPIEEKEPLRLQREGWFLVVAGSDTPARVLARIHFHLLNSPKWMAKLRQELHALGPNPGMQDLEHLPVLNACILEGNRLSFGLTRRNFRTAPEDTLMYNGFALPPGTPIAVSTLAVHADESVFPDPFSFDPERWLGPNAKELRRYLMSFGAKGPRSCLGVHLAEAELRVAVACTVRYDMELYETSEKDVAYKHDFQMPHGDLDSQGVRAVVKGIAKHW